MEARRLELAEAAGGSPDARADGGWCEVLQLEVAAVVLTVRHCITWDTSPAVNGICLALCIALGQWRQPAHI